jgi:hypothetical protein
MRFFHSVRVRKPTQRRAQLRDGNSDDFDQLFKLPKACSALQRRRYVWVIGKLDSSLTATMLLHSQRRSVEDDMVCALPSSAHLAKSRKSCK